MKKQIPFKLISFICLIGSLVQGATYYVWRDNPTPQEPYTTWNTAATEIQQAVNFATNANDVVLVTNGVYNSGGTVTPGYALTNRVCATNAITIRSVAPDVTGAVIVGAAADGGGHGSNAVRCVYLDGGASLVGFTLTGGYTQTNRTYYQNCSAGGVFMNSGSIVSNCLIATNAASYHGGGATCYYGGTLAQCEIVSNQTAYAGGGAFCYYGGAVNDCVIRGNVALSDNDDRWSGGGGVYCLSDHIVKGGIVTRCTIFGNRAKGTGGGIHYYRGASRVISCIVTNNVADGSAGGVYAWIGGSVSNCLVAHNRSNSGSTSAGGVYQYAGAVLEHSIIVDNYAHNVAGGVYNRSGTVNNCLIARNTARKNAGGVYCDEMVKNSTIVNNTVLTPNVGGGVSFGAGSGTLQNSIVWGNNASNIYYTGTPTISYTCSTPAPNGTENFADDPLFANTNRANYSLTGGSRCIDTGLFEPWMATGFDLVGQPRIRQGGVDRGALEYLPKWTTIIIR